jgi:hypothetical protein
MSFFQFSLFWIDLHGGMAVTAGKHASCKGRRRDRKLLRSVIGESRMTGA